MGWLRVGGLIDRFDEEARDVAGAGVRLFVLPVDGCTVPFLAGRIPAHSRPVGAEKVRGPHGIFDREAEAQAMTRATFRRRHGPSVG